MRTFKQKNINIKRATRSKIKRSSFCAKEKQIYVVDYANIMYILYNHLQDVDQVIIHFYRFLLTQTQKNNKVFLIAKPVKINNILVDLSMLLHAGKKLTSFTVDAKKLYVYNLTFPRGSKPSSVDDLVFWFIAISLFTELLVEGKNPRKVLHLLSNDKQYFNKIIFQLSAQELKELRLTTLDASGNEVKSPMEGHVKKNLKALMMSDKDKKEEAANLECTIENIIAQLPANVKNYEPCEKIQELSKKQLYVYGWIKYIQKYMYGDMYGSLSQDAILKTFT
jgi:hypothetical protein